MRKILIVVLFLVMSMNLTFYAAAAETIVYDAVQNGEEFRYNYENEIVLLDSTNVYMAADWLDYKNNGQGMELDLFLKVSNHTDQELEFKVTTLAGNVNNAHGRSMSANGTMRSCMTGSVYDWNGMFGETEDFYQGTFLIEILIGTEVVDSVQFDWYISETTPFANVVTSTGIVPENNVSNNTGTVEIKTSSTEEKTESTESVSEDLGNYTLSCSLFLGGTVDGKGLLETIQNYSDEIEKETDGHVKIEIFGSGSLLSREESYDGLSSGMVDIALIDSSCFPEKLTLSSSFSLPLQGFDDNVKATGAVWGLYEEYPQFAAEWDEIFKVFQLFTYPETIIKQTGLTDVSEIQEKGSIFGICANKELWDILPAQYQEVIETILSGKEVSMVSAEAVQANYLAMLDMYQGMGKPILYPADPEYAAWKALCDDYAAKWVEQITASKGIDGAVFLARAHELYANTADAQASEADSDLNDIKGNSEDIINTIYTDADTIYNVQLALNDLGYDCGTPDGMAGNMTRAAVIAYQTDHGLEASGNIDTILLISLGLIEEEAKTQETAKEEGLNITAGDEQIAVDMTLTGNIELVCELIEPFFFHQLAELSQGGYIDEDTGMIYQRGSSNQDELEYYMFYGNDGSVLKAAFIPTELIEE